MTHLTEASPRRIINLKKSPKMVFNRKTYKLEPAGGPSEEDKKAIGDIREGSKEEDNKLDVFEYVEALKEKHRPALMEERMQALRKQVMLDGNTPNIAPLVKIRTRGGRNLTYRAARFIGLESPWSRAPGIKPFASGGVFKIHQCLAHPQAGLVTVPPNVTRLNTCCFCGLESAKVALQLNKDRDVLHHVIFEGPKPSVDLHPDCDEILIVESHPKSINQTFHVWFS